MLKYTDLKKGVIFLMEESPWLVLESKLIKFQRQKPILKAKIKNLKTGAIITKSFTQADEFEEAEVEKKPLQFLYSHKGKFVFIEPQNPKERFEFDEGFMGEKWKYLKKSAKVEAVLINEEIVDIKLPIKMDFKVIEAPPSFKGDTAQGGTKTATIETGAKINVPMFIEVGDTIRVNTEDGSYVERVKE
ncbi:MAG: elongation factor P [Candidatus Pacebacteria bacterium]|nr:elongation factor P [Candidatus Paceibacterota bacterium]